ncbi:MAG: hypothetical protein ACPG46_00415 [Thalassotalea sp.]
MNTRWKLSFLAVSLIFLATISCFHISILHWAISNNVIAVNQLRFIPLINEQTFHQFQYQYSQDNSSAWLYSRAFLAKKDGKIAYGLAQYYQSISQERDAILWYQQALTLGNTNALKPLAYHYYDKGEWDKALTLAHKEKNKFWAQQLIVTIAVIEGKLSKVEAIAAQLETTKQGKLLLDNLQGYQIIASTPRDESQLNVNCLSVQLFGSTLIDLTHASNLIAALETSDLGQYFCMPTPRYISKQKLQCKHLAKQPIACNEAVWHKLKNTPQSQYLGVIVPNGGANVHSGILYLDRQDNIDVFKHELLHFLGFIDEYPLPAGHNFCQQVHEKATAHNLVTFKALYKGERKRIREKILARIPWRNLIKPSTPILSGANTKWKVGTPLNYKNDIGVFASATCQNSELLAVKPLSRDTSLTYFELPLPTLYKDFLAKNKRKYIMPSFHYNVAAALAKEGDKFNAQQWIISAEKFNSFYYD